jgi:hypothetical protein
MPELQHCQQTISPSYTSTQSTLPSSSRRWIGDGFPTDACSSASIPARPDVPCGASTQLTAINPRLAMGVDRSRLPLLRRSLGGVGLWIWRARWLSRWILVGVFVISSLSGSVLLFFQISCIGMFPGCECVRALCISFSVWIYYLFLKKKSSLFILYTRWSHRDVSTRFSSRSVSTRISSDFRFLTNQFINSSF